MSMLRSDHDQCDKSLDTLLLTPLRLPLSQLRSESNFPSPNCPHVAETPPHALTASYQRLTNSSTAEKLSIQRALCAHKNVLR